MEQEPLFVFTSHIDGKNAKVSLFPDRLEWARPRGVSGGKVTAGILTGGLSMLATGVKGGRSGTEMIPVRAMSSVSTARDGMLNSKVLVTASGAVVEFRVSHGEAKAVKDHLTRLMLGSHPALVQAAPAQVPEAAPTAVVDPMQQLAQLGQLRDAGVLSDAEFEGKKAEILARM